MHRPPISNRCAGVPRLHALPPLPPLPLNGGASRSKPTSAALPDQRRGTPGWSSSRKRGFQPAATAAMTRLLQRGAPRGERGSSAYMVLTPVFRDGAAGVQHHGRTEAGQIPGHADAVTYKGLSTPSTEAPTQLLPVLDIASTSLFWSCRSIGLRDLLSEQNTSLKIR